ncbi:MAG: hypothetical protein R3F43_12030 [bacterium]
MADGVRLADRSGRPETIPAWMRPFAQTIDAARKYVVSKHLAPSTGEARRRCLTGISRPPCGR